LWIEFNPEIVRPFVFVRNPQNQPAPTSEDAASTSEGDAPIKKKDQSTSSPWENFKNFFT
jgi:hypothetical protein